MYKYLDNTFRDDDDKVGWLLQLYAYGGSVWCFSISLEAGTIVVHNGDSLTIFLSKMYMEY